MVYNFRGRHIPDLVLRTEAYVAGGGAHSPYGLAHVSYCRLDMYDSDPAHPLTAADEELQRIVYSRIYGF